MISCQESTENTVDYDPKEIVIEYLEDIDMLYSDSAIIQFRIKSPMMVRYELELVPIEEFPKGFSIEFFDTNGEVTTQLYSKYAERRSSKGLLLLRDSVVYITTTKDQLETNFLTIDEVNGSIYSKKFFRMIKADTQDTIYGRGFIADSDFKRLEIVKYIGKRQSIDINSDE